MTIVGAKARTWRARDLHLELLDPFSVALTRLFQHPKMDWEAPDEPYRNKRVDPPDGHRSAFAVLYTASTVQTAAIECRVLNGDALDRYTWNQDLASRYKVVRYSFAKPALFVPIDGPNRELLGLEGAEVAFQGYKPYQTVALELFERFSGVVHGMSWHSFHRNQPGRSYAIWHHCKDAIGLKIESPDPRGSLINDADWKAFLAANPSIEAIAP